MSRDEAVWPPFEDASRLANGRARLTMRRVSPTRQIMSHSWLENDLGLRQEGVEIGGENKEIWGLLAHPPPNKK